MIQHGTFLSRPNRFVAEVRLEDGSPCLAHVASSGRMKELLVPGAPVVISGSGMPGAKTAGLLSLVRHQETWVSVDTSLPGKLLRQAFLEGTLPPFAGYRDVRPEFTYGESRLDFLLNGLDLPPCLVEVKSVTSVLPDSDGVPVARFPDAPTERGAKHLRELERALGEGYRAAVCFVVQRDDARAFGPWDRIDPAFGAALRATQKAGVELHVWAARFEPGKACLAHPLPLRI